jgi:hypothetical protein
MNVCGNESRSFDLRLIRRTHFADRKSIMTPKMTAEQREAVQSAMGPVPIEDDVTKETYFIVDSPTMEALRRQEDLAAIREGLDDIAAGRVSPLDESIARIRAQLGLPDSQ